MIIKKLKKAIGFIFADEEDFSLEHRLFLSSIIIGFLISLVGGSIVALLSLSPISIYTSFLLAGSLFVIFYLVRFKKIVEPLIIPILVTCFLGISIIWVFTGGMNGPNIIPAYLILIISIIIVPERKKKFLIWLFAVLVTILYLLQYYIPDLIVDYPDETSRWIDSLTTAIYTAFFMYLIITFFHKHYTLERIRAEENERIFRSLSENSQDYISRYDRQHKHIYVNKATVDISKLSVKEIIGKTLSNTGIFDEKQCEKWESKIEEVFTQQHPIFEQFVLEKEHENLYLDCRFYPEFGNKNEIVSVLCVSRDITYLKKSEIKLSQLNDDKDRFISILAHDLKNPFNSILGYLNLLTKNIRKYDIDKIEKQINLVNYSAKHVYSLLEDILTWARVQSGNLPYEPQTLSFEEICSEIQVIFNQNVILKNITCNYISTGSINVFADKNMFKTILRNLVSNAIKYSYKGGEINVSISENNESSNFKTITVSDNGTGIEADKLTNLFDISQIISKDGTDNEKGTGFGLILCKEFVEKHGGTIWAESEIGKGSSFKFTIPSNL